MIYCGTLSKKDNDKVSQKLYDYLADNFREYCDFSYVNFYEPSDELMKMVMYAKNKILDFCVSATFPNSFILFEFDVVPKFDGLASLIIQDDYLSKFDINAKYASLIYKNHFENTRTCVVNNLIYMTSGMPTGHDIWETVHDLATLRIMGNRDYVKSNDSKRYQRAILLEKDLKEKGWNVDNVLKQLLNSSKNHSELRKCFGYYYEYTFSNTIGHIYPKE